MVFHSMKKMKKNSGPAEYHRVEELVNDGWYVIPNFIKEPKDKTVIRLLPALDETGMPYDLLNPEGSYEDIDNTLGMAFTRVEVFSAWLGGKHNCVSTVNFDNAGNEMPAGRSPLYTIADRIRYKGYEQLKRQEMGLEIDAPSRWLQWRESNIINTPTEQMFIQCLLLEEQGTVVADIDGTPSVKSKCIIMLPLSATEGLFRALCKKHDRNLPLSDSNNKFGDIHSIANGCVLELSKTIVKKNAYYFELGEVMPLEAEDLRDIEPWENVIKIPTVEESIQYCLNIFKDPEMVDYGLRNSEIWSKYIPDSCRNRAKNIREASSIKDLQNIPVTQKPIEGIPTPPKRTFVRASVPGRTPVTPEVIPQESSPVRIPAEVVEPPVRRRTVAIVNGESIKNDIPKEVNQTLRDNLNKMRAARHH